MTDPLHITYGLLINRAYQPAFLAEPESADLGDLGYVLAGVIYGTDPGGLVTPYGFVAKSLGMVCRNLCGPKGTLVAAIRGTNSPGEWFEDFQAILVDSDFCDGAETEMGFTNIYRTLRLGPGGPPLRTALAGSTGLTATGHSLGGPLATMLAGEVRADALVGWASPKPGNGRFADWIRSRVPSIDLYANAPDAVPHTPLTLPPFEEFQHVDSLTVLSSAKLPYNGGLLSRLHFAHSLDVYLHLLDPAQPLPSP